VVWTPSYVTDPRIPRDPDDIDVADRMGLGAMAAAPLRAPGGEVIGTLAVSYRQPGSIPPDRLATLQALADHAAIALSNSDLLERVEASEANYRGLVQTTPDVIWRNDADGRFTFLADTAEALFGHTPAELLGQHFGFVVAEESMDLARATWAGLSQPDASMMRLRFVIRRKDGTTFPSEVTAVGRFDDGRFAGAQGTIRDISERERLEREVRSSEERYRSLVQSSPDLIFEMDGRGVYTFYSDRTEDVIGWLPGELIGHSFTEFIDLEAFPQARERLAEIAANPGRPSTDRLLIRHKDGHRIPFEVSVVGQVDDGGRLVAIRGVARDIGERERLELELRASEERYRFLVENAPDIVFSADKETRFVFISDTIERLTGFRPDEVVGETFERVIAPTSMHVAVERWERVVANPTEPQVLRLDLMHKDGGTVPVEIHSVAQLDNEGNFAGVHGSARDIAERERLERELRESEVRYRYLVQSSPDLVWMTDDAGRLTFVSDQSSTILGWEPEELIGRSFSELAPPEERRGALARFRALRHRPHEVHRTRLKILDRGGRELAMEITSIGMVQDGEFIGAHGAARDVSERDRLERDLRRQAVELASSEERSHLARELHDSVTQALFSMTLLSRSIELLLVKDPSQVPGKLASLRDLQREALAEMRALIFELRPGNVEENGLIQALRTHSAALSGRIGLPVVVEGDLAARPPIDVEEGLYRIAQEALHNVVKHAGAKQVRVEVGRVPDGVHLRVADDGRGFDPTAVPDGHLGLTGMQARAERLGGVLTVASVRDGGTTIDVTIPDARSAEVVGTA
jgi:PAS domain S-box-containing protein